MYKGLNVSVPAALEALERADGDKKAAYSQYIKIYFENTGRLDVGCDNSELQEFYKKYEEGENDDRN